MPRRNARIRANYAIVVGDFVNREIRAPKGSRFHVDITADITASSGADIDVKSLDDADHGARCEHDARRAAARCTLEQARRSDARSDEILTRACKHHVDLDESADL